MTDNRQGDRERDASRQLQAAIDLTYPKGWFVATEGGRIIAAAADFPELERLTRETGKNLRAMLVIQAGLAIPEQATILFKHCES